MVHVRGRSLLACRVWADGVDAATRLAGEEPARIVLAGAHGAAYARASGLERLALLAREGVSKRKAGEGEEEEGEGELHVGVMVWWRWWWWARQDGGKREWGADLQCSVDFARLLYSTHPPYVAA